MNDRRTALSQLRNALATLYPDETSARRVVADAGMDIRRIPFTPHALNNWHAILTEATKGDHIDALVQVALAEYGGNTPLGAALIDAAAAYQRQGIGLDVHTHEDENPGLYLARLINPQRRGSGDIVSTVWLNVRGPHQYIIDSIHIHDLLAGMAGPVAELALAPDAAYSFTYADGTDRVEALNPALSIGPQTRRQASFTLSTAPEEPLYGIGRLAIWLRYHTPDGRSGTLLLDEPFEHGRILCHLVNKPVRVQIEYNNYDLVEQIVVPPGLSRGIDDGEVTPFLYRILKIPDLAYDALKDIRATWGQALTQRAPLLRAILDGGSVDVVASRLGHENYDVSQCAADLCGTIGAAHSHPVESEQATQALLDRLATHPLDRDAIYGLAVRHIAQPDDLLAKTVLDTSPLVNRDEPYQWSFDPAISALVVYPVGRWLDALLALADENPRALDALRAARDRMDAEKVERVIAYCRQRIIRRGVQYALVILLIDLLGSPDVVTQMLQDLPFMPEDDEPPDEEALSEQMDFRQYLVDLAVERQSTKGHPY